MGNDDDMMDLSDPLLLCEQTLESSKMIEADSDMCLEMKFQTEMMCCPTLATNPCPICPNGISSGGDNPFFSLFGAMGEGLDDNSTDVAGIDLSGYDFCELAVDSGRFMEADSDMCQEAITGTSFLCCPEGVIEGACTFCPDGITADENYYLTLGFNETEAADAALGCQQMAGLVQMFEAGTEECNGMGIMAVSCCPGTQVEVEGNCSFCKDGITLDENSPFFAGTSESDIANFATTCEQMKGYALMFDEGSDSCHELDQSKVMCCPAPLENGCNLCPNGINTDGNLMIGDNETALEEHMNMCQESASYYNLFEAESEVCKQGIEFYEMACCPQAINNPCTMCPNGIVPIDEHPFIEYIGDDQADQAENHASCAPSIAYYAQIYEADSSICLDTKPNMEMMCCPTEHENPCLICPSGITVSADDEIYDQCNQNVQIAKVLEAGTEDCGGYLL